MAIVVLGQILTKVLKLARYWLVYSLQFQNLPLGIGIGRSLGQSKGDFERIGKRAGERTERAGRALDGPRKLSRVCQAGIVSGNRADRAALP
jgi:hypothetical protein